MSMKPNYKDERGEITDLVVGKDVSVTRVTFTKKAIRGNHYHNKTLQKDIVIKGRLICIQDYKGSVTTTHVYKGDIISHRPGVAHAYKALTNSEIISVCFGKRVGENYESDTIRLKNPLI